MSGGYVRFDTNTSQYLLPPEHAFILANPPASASTARRSNLSPSGIATVYAVSGNQKPVQDDRYDYDPEVGQCLRMLLIWPYNAQLDQVAQNPAAVPTQVVDDNGRYRQQRIALPSESSVSAIMAAHGPSEIDFRR